MAAANARRSQGAFGRVNELDPNPQSLIPDLFLTRKETRHDVGLVDVRMRLGAVAIAAAVALGATFAVADPSVDLINQPYVLDTGLTSRSISFENPDRRAGRGRQGGQQPRPRPQGRPGATIKPGETVQLCDIEGPGHHPPHLDHHAAQSRQICGRWSSAPGGTARSTRASSARSATSSASPTARSCPTSRPSTRVGRQRRHEHLAAHAVCQAGEVHLHQRRQEGRAALLPDRLHARRQASRATSAGCTSSSAARTRPREKQDFELLPMRNEEGPVHRLGDRHPQSASGAVVGRGRNQGLHGRRQGVSHHLRHGQRRLRRPGLGHPADAVPVQRLQPEREGEAATFVSMYRWHLPDPIAWQKEARITIQQIA